MTWASRTSEAADEPGAPLQSPEQLAIENALLRGSLWLTARALKDYRDARHVKADDQFQLTVPASLPARADEALARANAVLRDQGRER